MTLQLVDVAELARMPGMVKPAVPPFDLEKLLLDVVKQQGRSVDIRDKVTKAGLNRTIYGASSFDIEIEDEDRDLLRSGLLDRAIDLDIGGEVFRYVKPTKTGDRVTMECEDQVAAVLRLIDDPRKWSRAKFTRAQAILAQVREPKRYRFGFFALELNKRQPLAGLDKAQRDAVRQPGIADGADITVKGVKADRRQVRNIETALSVGEDLGASKRALLAGLVAGIVESLFRDMSGGDRDSIGVLQVRVGIHGREVAGSVEESYRKFYSEGFTGRGGAIKLARENPGWTPGQIAQAVQGSAFPDRYDQYRDEADKIMAAYSGGVTNRATYFEPFEYTRGEPDGPRGENAWQSITRLADSELGLMLFPFGGTVFYGAQEDFYRGRALATLDEDTPGIDSIDFGASDTREVSQATVTCRADVWGVPQGSNLILRGMGPADGRWLTVEIDRGDIFDQRTVVTLEKPAEELPEPRGQTRTRSTGGGGQLANRASDVELGKEWGGSQSVIDQFVTPFMRSKGLDAGSAKRTPAENAAVGGAPGSDHLTTNKKSYAVDYPTADGEQIARALARAIGWSAWQANSYARFAFEVDGKKFTIQILWGAGIQHGDHIHVGVRREG